MGGNGKGLRVCLVPRLTGMTGGPASFQRKLMAGLLQRGIQVTCDLDDEPYGAVLVINGTRHLHKLWRCKRRGVPIVQRLGAINRFHRVHRSGPVGLRDYVMSEIVRNGIMRLVRSYLADHVVYQSHFVKEWWERERGPTKVGSSVIYNGVDLALFNPLGPAYQSRAETCVISVEGTQGADPFDIGIQLARGLEGKGRRVELLMFGVPFRNAEARMMRYPFATFKGAVPNAELPHFYRGAAFYIFTDLYTAACPNSVLEALGCGTPVLGYNAGALSELLRDSAGRLVEWNGDPWRGDPPNNLEGIMNAALELVGERSRFGEGARKLAEECYGLDAMVDAYVEVFRGVTGEPVRA